MFDRARLRLTGWYASMSFLVLVLLELATFVALTRGLDQQLDEGVESVVSQRLASVGDPNSLPPLILQPGPALDPDDTFLIVFNAAGQLVEDPLRTAVEPYRSQIALSTSTDREGRTYRTLTMNGEHVRVVTAPIRVGDRTAGTILAGRSLTRRDAQVIEMMLVLGAAAAAGLLASTIAGYFLAGRTLRPIVENHERQRRFVANASHELRSPIAVIRTAADIIAEEPLSPSQQESVDTIRDVADESSALVTQLLELARLDDKTAIDTTPSTDLAVPVGDEIERLRARFGDHQTVVTAALEPALAHILPAEVGRITRVLLENVLTHTPSGTAVRVVTAVDAASRAILFVQDDGPGVPQSFRERLFERFARADEARTPGATNGAGLGLAIVREIAEAYGGDVSASAPPGGGLRVTVFFPAAHASRATGSAQNN